MPHQEGNKESEGSYLEEQKTGDTGYMPHVWDKDFSNRKGLTLILGVIRIDCMAGCLHYGVWRYPASVFLSHEIVFGTQQRQKVQLGNFPSVVQSMKSGQLLRPICGRKETAYSLSAPLLIEPRLLNSRTSVTN